MKALVIGLGSMGKRRIRLMKGIDPSVEIIGVDTNPERRAQVEEMGHKTYRSIDDARCEKPDLAFVSTSPTSHYAIIKSLLGYKINTFTELNLVSDGYEELMSMAKESGTVRASFSAFNTTQEIGEFAHLCKKLFGATEKAKFPTCYWSENRI